MPEPEAPDPGLRVLIVDDHEMVAESLRRGMEREADIESVHLVATVRDAVRQAARERYDIVLMDYRLPDGTGIDATEQILAARPSTRIIMLSGSGDPEAMPAAIAAGCVGYLEKQSPFDELVAAVRRAHAGEAILSAHDLGRVLSAQRPPPSQLTARELEVLELLAEGLVNRAIADRLYVSPDTVRTHVQNLLGKLGAHTRLEAVAIARRSGLLP